MYMQKMNIKTAYQLYNDISVMIPSDELSEIEFKKLKDYDYFNFKVEKCRDYELHKKHFAQIKTCFDNLPDEFKKENFINSLDDLRINIYYEIGYTIKFYNIRKKCFEITVDSIKFQNIGQVEFIDRVFKPTENLICRLLNISADELNKKKPDC